MEKEVEALKSVVVEHQRDAQRRSESEAALRRENQKLRADAELIGAHRQGDPRREA